MYVPVFAREWLATIGSTAQVATEPVFEKKNDDDEKSEKNMNSWSNCVQFDKLEHDYGIILCWCLCVGCVCV